VKFFITILFMAVVIVSVTFALQNTDNVTIKYYNLMQQTSIPAYLLIFFSFLAGIIVAGLIGIIERFRLNLRVSKLRKEIKGLESDLYECRKQVLAESSAKSSVPLSEQDLL
jgi:uncharacterized membrane protein YciS (DUF1049 family)